MLEMRPYRPSDLVDIYEVCLRTGDSGGDATGLYSSDALVADIYAGPYLAYAPELASVVSDGERVVGYQIGVADTADFVRWYRANWLSSFAARHPLVPANGAAVVADSTLSEAERRMVEFGHEPERMLNAELTEYPAHLHIDLLPIAQGHGFGRALIDGFRARLRALCVPGVHLGYAPSNLGAAAFYDRLGFHHLAASTPGSPLVGIATAS